MSGNIPVANIAPIGLHENRVMNFLVRKHFVPRTDLFIPDGTCPLKEEWLDLYRITKTSLPSEQEAEIHDIWRPDEAQPVLSAPWVGETIFELRERSVI